MPPKAGIGHERRTANVTRTRPAIHSGQIEELRFHGNLPRGHQSCRMQQDASLAELYRGILHGFCDEHRRPVCQFGDFHDTIHGGFARYLTQAISVSENPCRSAGMLASILSHTPPTPTPIRVAHVADYWHYRDRLLSPSTRVVPS